MSHRNRLPKPSATPRTWKRWSEPKHSANRNPDRFNKRKNPYGDNDDNSGKGSEET